MLQILCSSVRSSVRGELLARANLIFLREQPDDFFSVGNPGGIIQFFFISKYTLFQISTIYLSNLGMFLLR